jgi:hypothetical protein
MSAYDTYGKKNQRIIHELSKTLSLISAYSANIILITIVIPYTYAQANSSGTTNETEGSDQNKNMFWNEFWKDYTGDIIATSSASIAVGALIYNIKQTQNNQKNFDAQLKSS